MKLSRLINPAIFAIFASGAFSAAGAAAAADTPVYVASAVADPRGRRTTATPTPCAIRPTRWPSPASGPAWWWAKLFPEVVTTRA